MSDNKQKKVLKEKKGFFAKLMDKLDKKLEEKAKQKSCCCCANDNNKSKSDNQKCC